MFSYRNRSIECIRTDEGFQSLKDEWNHLLSDSRSSDNVFLTWEWMYTWWKIFKGESKLVIVTIRDKKSKLLLCVAPFMRILTKYLAVVPISRIQFIGTGEDEKDRIGSRYLDIIVIKKAKKEEDLLYMLFEYVLKEEIWDEIILENLRDDSITLKLLKELRHDKVREQLIVEKEWSRYLMLYDTWDGFWTALLSKYRHNINKTVNALEGLGDMKFNMVETEEDLAQTFEDLVELQRQDRVWKAKRDLGVFASDKFYQFHSAILRTLLSAGNLMMARLTINDELCGIIYNIHYNGLVSFYQLGIKKSLGEENSRIRAGFALHLFAIKKAIELGCREYDFLMDDSRAIYKAYWLHDVRKIFNVTMIRDREFKIYTDRIAVMHKDEISSQEDFKPNG